MKIHWAKALALLAPSALGLALFYLVPLACGLPFSLWSPAKGFLGVEAFAATLHNPMFLLGLRNSALFLAICVPATLLTALLISLFLMAAPLGSKWLQSALFLPYVLPTVSALFAFRWLLDYNGVVNRLLSLLGGQRVAWFSGSALRATVLALFLWKNVGFYVALMSTRLNASPRDLVDCAMLDGANAYWRFRAVYLPHLMPTLVFSLVLCAVQAMDIFRECFLLAGSYPAPEAYTLQHYLYNRFHSGDYASAAAALYAVLPVLALMVWGLLKGEANAEEK
jgi:multiple sugar transport system permease protein